MALKPPSLWIEKRGHQHRVYWRNTVSGLPARSYVPFYGRAEAEQFVGMAGLGLLGLHTARQVLDTDDPLDSGSAAASPPGDVKVRDDVQERLSGW